MSSGKVILALQVSGFAACVILLAAWHSLIAMAFAIAFAIHFAGDMIFLRQEGLPKVKFNIEQYVILAPWLQFVGLMLAFGGLAFIVDYPHLAKFVLFGGLGVSAAGFVYEKIYP